MFDGPQGEVGLIVQGGLYNALMRSLGELGLVGEDGTSEIPIKVLNVVYPLVPEEITAFAEG